MKLYPPITLPSGPHPNKSGWLKSTPVSITATLIPEPSNPSVLGISVPTYGTLFSMYVLISFSDWKICDMSILDKITNVMEKIIYDLMFFLVF